MFNPEMTLFAWPAILDHNVEMTLHPKSSPKLSVWNGVRFIVISSVMHPYWSLWKTIWMKALGIICIRVQLYKAHVPHISCCKIKQQMLQKKLNWRNTQTTNGTPNILSSNGDIYQLSEICLLIGPLYVKKRPSLTPSGLEIDTSLYWKSWPS